MSQKFAEMAHGAVFKIGEHLYAAIQQGRWSGYASTKVWTVNGIYVADMASEAGSYLDMRTGEQPKYEVVGMVGEPAAVAQAA